MPPLRPGSSPRPLPDIIRPRGYNRGGLYLAVFIAACCIPFTLKFQVNHTPNMAGKRWQMLNLRDTTGSQAIKRFGPPAVSHDYSLTDGVFAGPEVGLKHYYRVGSAGYDEALKSPVVWKWPDYSTVREMIWKLPDSYLTVWLHEPRAEISLEGDQSQIILPDTSKGEWVALDNYRVGNDLIKTPPVLK